MASAESTAFPLRFSKTKRDGLTRKNAGFIRENLGKSGP